jgi:hypothetical protein
MDRWFDVRIPYMPAPNMFRFVPVDGEMKPDTPQVRELLREAGILSD